jgi:hypothetical protein
MMHSHLFVVPSALELLLRAEQTTATLPCDSLGLSYVSVKCGEQLRVVKVLALPRYPRYRGETCPRSCLQIFVQPISREKVQ